MRSILLFACLLSFTALRGQFSDSVHHYLRFGATGIFNNTSDGKSFMLNNALSYNINRKKISFNSSNAWVYGRQDRLLTNNDFSSIINFDILKTQQKFYYWGLGTFTSSYSLKINHQFQGGGGIGYNAINKKDAEIVISDGFLYESGDLETDQGKDRYNTVRNSLRLKHHFVINSILSLDGSHFWQPSLQSFKDYIIRSSSSLSVKLRRWLSLTTALTYNRFSRTDRENLLISFGLVAESYF